MSKKSYLLEKISVEELLKIIPDEEIAALAIDSKVDYYSKVLYGRSTFYLLLYGLLQIDRTSQRGLEDVFNSRKFKILFNICPKNTVRHSSISERLSAMDVSFFEKIFELIYQQFSTLYSESEMLSSNIIRVDSTMVAEASSKLFEGMCVGCKKDGKKQIKYTVSFDGLFPSGVEIFSSQKALSEELTIPNVVFSQAKKQKSKVYVFDRGVSKRTTFSKMSDEKIEFVSRLNAGSRYHCVELLEEGNGRQIGRLFLVKQEKIQLYKDGKKQLLTETFRLITAENEQGETFCFLTNIFDLEAEVIILYYKKRWDIEVFFRFLKQELNFKHFISTSENGIKIMLYMTLILAMLLMIYKRINQLGYKTAKRRFNIELDEIIMKMLVIKCGGDPDIVFHRKDIENIE
jgi:transposase